MLEASNVKLEQMREIIREKDQIIQVWNLNFKGSSDPRHIIFEINVGNRRIRHKTIQKL